MPSRFFGGMIGGNSGTVSEFTATYNVTSTTQPTQLLGIAGFNISQIIEMYIDGVSVTPVLSYTFSTTGTHLVKCVVSHNFTSAYYMFYYCSALTSIDLTGLDTSNVTDMRYMFQYCSALTSIDLTGLDTSNVTTMRGMFTYCSALTSIDLTGLDTSNVTDMGYMFQSCSALTSIDLTGLDTSNVTTMAQMFYNCKSITEITMSGDVSNVTNVSNMFALAAHNGNFYYNAAYDYSAIIAKLYSTWTATGIHFH